MKKTSRKLLTLLLLISAAFMFCGIDGCEKISGLVSGDVQEGVTIKLTGDFFGSTITASDGSYSFDGLSSGNYTLTPKLMGFTFDPASRDVSIPDDTSAIDFAATAFFIDNDDGTVTDNRTGLIWLKDANCYGAQSWDSAGLLAEELTDGECGLSDGSSEGDWRMPAKEELCRLGTNPPITWDIYDPPAPWSMPGPPLFDNVQSNFYWSGTEEDSIVWVMKVSRGYTGTSNKNVPSYVWPVRSDN